MTAIHDVASTDHLEQGRECLRTGNPDIAADFFRLAYRTEIARIVAEMVADAGPGLQLVRRWSLDDMWAGWAALSLYHRARRDGLERVEFYSDLAPQSAACATQGRYWIDRNAPGGAPTRLLMPDAFLHVHTQLARNRAVQVFLPDLIQALRASDQLHEATRHEVEASAYQVVARWSHLAFESRG